MVKVHPCGLGEPTQKLPRYQAQLDVNTDCAVHSHVGSIFRFIFNFELCASVCGYVYMSESVQGGQKRAQIPLQLDLQAVESHLMWVLEP